MRETPAVERIHPAGTVGVYTDHIARFSDFTVSISSLQVPQGTQFAWSRGVYLAYNTNRFVREMQGEWLFLMDDDHRFDPDILMRLLDHDVDVAVALTSKKFPPYEPVLYERTGEAYSDLKSIELKGKSGLIEVDACGKPGMLIRKHVLDAIGDPWCEYKDSEQGAEDWDLSYKIRKAGFKIHADLDNKLGHMAPVAIYKQQDPNGNWGTMLAVSNEGGVFLPD
jgi:GT2 family glycosyltransferase